jgi:hypothetical protein
MKTLSGKFDFKFGSSSLNVVFNHGKLLVHGKPVRVVVSKNKKYLGWMTFTLNSWTYYVKMTSGGMRIGAFHKGKMMTGSVVKISGGSVVYIIGGSTAHTSTATTVNLKQFIGKGFMFQRFGSKPQVFMHLRKSALFADKLVKTQAFLKDAQFVVVAGLAGSGVSLRSATHPKMYIRHKNFFLYANANDKSAVFKKDATFNIRNSVSAGQGYSLESLNHPGYFITVVGKRLKIVKKSAALKMAATWLPVTAQVEITHQTQVVTDGEVFNDDDVQIGDEFVYKDALESKQNDEN